MSPTRRDEQHDNHIWLTVCGSSWAIRCIHWPIFYLWRGYMHDGTLELASVEIPPGYDFDAYCEQAVFYIDHPPTHHMPWTTQ
jgi:hypothetical protein